MKKFLNHCVLIIFIIIVNCAIFVKCVGDSRDTLIDISCRTNVDCYQYQINSINSTCINGECMCVNNELDTVSCASNDTDTHSISNKVGGKCPCKIQNSICTLNNDCICDTHFIASPDLLRCIPVAVDLGKTCETDSQCIIKVLLSYCHPTKRICLCHENYIVYNAHCEVNVALNKTCNDDAQCEKHTMNSVCKWDHCVCDRNFVTSSNNNACLPVAKYHGNCTENQQCSKSSGMICDSGICVCDANYIASEWPIEDDLDDTICIKRINVRDSCREHTDCFELHKVGEAQTMKCYNRACVCRDGFEEENRKCVLPGKASEMIPTFAIILICVIINLIK